MKFAIEIESVDYGDFYYVWRVNITSGVRKQIGTIKGAFHPYEGVSLYLDELETIVEFLRGYNGSSN